MKRLDVFRIPAYEFYYPDHYKHVEKWIDYNETYNKYVESPNKQVKLSLPNLHKKEIFSPLTEFFRESLNKVIEDLGWQFEIDITSMWSTIQGRNGQHHVHTHNNCMFVGTYYVYSDIIDTSGTTFYNVMSDFRMIKVSGKYGGWGSPNHKRSSGTSWYDVSHNVPFEEGKLVIYPGWMRHGGKPHMGDDRHIIAFNAMPIGQTDSDPLQRYHYADFRNSTFPYDEE